MIVVVKIVVVAVVVLQFSSVQFKVVCMCSEKPICAPPRLRIFRMRILAFETVPMFV